MNDDTMRTGANPDTDTTDHQGQPMQSAIRSAVSALEGNLERTTRFLELCEDWTAAPSKQALDALRSASRLLRAQADTAVMLARVARGESRHRSIVEYADGSGPRGRLNSKFSEAPPGRYDHLSDDELRDHVMRKLFPPGFSSGEKDEEAPNGRDAPEE